MSETVKPDPAIAVPLSTRDGQQTPDRIVSRGRSRADALISFRQVVPINAGVTLINVTAISLLLLGEIEPRWLVGWWLLHAVTFAAMMYRWLGEGGKARSPERSQRLRRFDILSAIFSGACWGASALFLPHLGQERQLLVVMVAAGMIAGSAATLAVVPRAAIAFMLTIALPFITYFLMQATPIALVMAVASTLFTAAMMMTNRIVNGVIRRNRRLHEENTALYERIRSAQAELLDIAESTEAFAFLDPRGRLQLWNSRLPRVLGLDEAQMQRGGSLEALLRSAGLPDTLLASETSGGALQLPNGRWVQVSRRATPHDDQALIVIDVTEQQQASAQLQQQNSRLEDLFRQVSDARDAAQRASQAKSIFLANMSHELRTPLNAIIGFSDIVQKKLFGDAPEKYDEYLVDINGSARHLLGVIDDILDLARIEAKQIVLNEQPVMLDEELQISARLAASHYGRNIHATRLDVPDDLPPLHADPRLVRQIMINLIGNALKFSPSGVPVQISARHDAGTGELSVAVRDQGIGIAPEDHKRIFDAFEQADSQLSRNYGGVGLGLSLVRAFVLAHQGRIAIDSAPGHGTTITVTFPASRTALHAE